MQKRKKCKTLTEKSSNFKARDLENRFAPLETAARTDATSIAAPTEKMTRPEDQNGESELKQHSIP